MRRFVVFFFQAEDGIRDATVTGVQTCALPIWRRPAERDLELRGDEEIVEAAVEQQRPDRRLVEQRGHDPAVNRPRVAVEVLGDLDGGADLARGAVAHPARREAERVVPPADEAGPRARLGIHARHLRPARGAPGPRGYDGSGWATAGATGAAGRAGGGGRGRRARGRRRRSAGAPP